MFSTVIDALPFTKGAVWFTPSTVTVKLPVASLGKVTVNIGEVVPSGMAIVMLTSPGTSDLETENFTSTSFAANLALPAKITRAV